MRRHVTFPCKGDSLTGTIDPAEGSTGLLWVSGGNEIRAGAHAGQARLAHLLALSGYPVFRYDRRGIGDSEGKNTGFLKTAPDIHAAAQTFRDAAPHVNRIVAFGNCDAATALALFHGQAGIDRLVLANPWVIENQKPDTLPPPSAVRSRYLAKLRDPKALLGLFTGKVDFRKLRRGLKQATAKPERSLLAGQLHDALIAADIPVDILLAERDRTALAFHDAWNDAAYSKLRTKASVRVHTLASASHSFADAQAEKWLLTRIVAALES